MKQMIRLAVAFVFAFSMAGVLGVAFADDAEKSGEGMKCMMEMHSGGDHECDHDKKCDHTRKDCDHAKKECDMKMKSKSGESCDHMMKGSET